MTANNKSNDSGTSISDVPPDPNILTAEEIEEEMKSLFDNAFQNVFNKRIIDEIAAALIRNNPDD